MPVTDGRSRWVEAPSVAPWHENRGTRIATVTAGVVDYRREFCRHYEAFRCFLAPEIQPGVGVVAIDHVEARLAGVGFAAAKIGEANAMIVGRHGAADLSLRGDPTLSLRQLAVVVDPLTDLRGRGVVYRVIDLRSNQGLSTEENRVLGGFRADGPGFFHIGRYVVFVFITGDPTDWPDSAADAWSFIPERIYLEEQDRRARGSRPRRAVPLHRAHTLIEATVTPERLSDRHLLEPGEQPVAELAINGRRRVRIGTRALETGILIGRSHRCDSSEAFEHAYLSRVHLLIVQSDRRVYAIDTASSNGTYIAEDESLRIRAMDTDTTLQLAHVAEVRWRLSGPRQPLQSAGWID